MFVHPSTSVTASVALFRGVLDAIGLGDGDAVALDLEVTDGQTAAAQVDQWAQDALRLMENKLGRKPLVYADLSFGNSGCCKSLGPWKLWIADPSWPAGHPCLPWPRKSRAIHKWQIVGIDSDVAAYGSVAAMRAALGNVPPSSMSVSIGTVSADTPHGSRRILNPETTGASLFHAPVLMSSGQPLYGLNASWNVLAPSRPAAWPSAAWRPKISP